MKDNKTVIEKINAWFSKENIPAVAAIDEKKERMDKLIAFCANKETKTVEVFEEVVTTDQITLVIEPAIEVGAAIATVVEGVAEPAPAATYELPDGRKIVVVESGVIAEIMEAETTEEETVVEEVDMNADTKTLPEANAKIKRLIESVSKTTEFSEQLKKDNEDLKARLLFQEKEMDELKKGVHQFKSDTKEMMEEIFSIPSKEPVVKAASPFKKEEKVNIFLKRKN
jgi:hypothetical protein